jgi:hypothetical protein
MRVLDACIVAILCQAPWLGCDQSTIATGTAPPEDGAVADAAGGEDAPLGDATAGCPAAGRPASCGTDGCGNSLSPACTSGLWTCPPVSVGSACALDAGWDGATGPDVGTPGLGVPCPVYSDASVPSRCLEGMLCTQDQASPAACIPMPAVCGDDAGFVAMCLCIGAHVCSSEFGYPECAVLEAGLAVTCSVPSQ